MKLNRIWIAIILIVFFSAFYEMGLKPQSRPLYERALDFYHQGKYSASLSELERAYAIEPNSTAILVLMGWDHLKLGQTKEAEADFNRASSLDPKLVEAKLGVDYVAVQSGRGEAAVEDIRALLKQDPNNSDFRVAAAAAFRQAGRNGEAVELYKGLLNDSKVGKLARINLQEIYGLENSNEEIPAGLPPLKRPGELQLGFRTSTRFLQRRAGSSWENFYVKGVDIDPGTPGRFASEAPVLAKDYLTWFDQISHLGANTIRVYAALPPAFYRALKRHNESSDSPHLYLLQEISLGAPENTNLFSGDIDGAARQEIARVIDLIHGQGDLPMRPGRASGLYTADISDSVLGFLIGRDLPSHVVLANNQTNASRNSYAGRYVSIPKGNPTEVWIAGLMDYAIQYEVDKYNAQRPVAFSNFPALDPLTHPSESTLLQEIAIRRNQGEGGVIPPGPNEGIDDNDSASVDETHFEAHSDFQGGIFAAYGVFPYYPDFMYRDSAYLSAQDSEGVNPFFGYLKALKAYEAKLPLVILEYGVPTSIGASHLTPNGWNDGGLTEREQGEALARMTRNIAAAGCAGGLVFEWQDEWYKANWLTGPLELPTDRRPMWNNLMDPDQGFGLVTFDPSRDADLFAGTSGWKSLPSLYAKDTGSAIALNDGWDAERTLHALAVSSDEAYVYLRLQVGSLRKGPNDVPDLKGASYFIGINTAPGKFGGQVVPGLVPTVRTDSGANFLLYITDGGRARLLISSNYNPREARPILFTATPTTQISYRIPFEPKVERWSGFEEMVVEPNRRRFSPDGRMFPALRYSQSQLRYRAAGRTEDTVATWTADFAGRSLIFRIPWALLMVTDPSSHRVLAATRGGPEFVTQETPGMELFALSFRPGDTVQFQQISQSGAPVADSLPAVANGVLSGLKTYSWPRWNEVKLQSRVKSGFASVQKAFRELGVPPS